MNLMKRKQEIESRLTEIRSLSTNETDVEKLTAVIINLVKNRGKTNGKNND
jgi:hypothetical protein